MTTEISGPDLYYSNNVARWGGSEAYLPRMLVGRLLERGLPPQFPHVDRFDGGILRVDLTECLAESSASGGRRAATVNPADSGRFVRVDASADLDQLDRAYGPVIDAVCRHGGSVVGFGRADVLAVFPGDSGAARGRAAAADIERHCSAQSRAVSQRLHFGTVDAIHVGDAVSASYLVGGAAVAIVAAPFDGTRVNSLAVTDAAMARIDAPVEDAPAATGDTDALRPYVPLAVRGAVERADGSYRPVSCLYLQTREWAGAALQSFYLTLRDVLARYEGTLVKVHASETGLEWLCAFGMTVAHEDDAERAARAALELQTEVSGKIDMRGGLHGGVVAAVAIGTDARRSLELVGDVVGIARGAMTCADWGSSFTTVALRRFMPGIQALPRGEYPLGEHGAIALASLFGHRPAARAVNVIAPLVGRDNEIRTLRDALANALDGGGAAIAIRGEAGLGKSRLKHDVTQMASPLGYAVHRGQALSVGGVAYGVIAQLLRSAMGLPEAAEREQVLERVRTECQRLSLAPQHRHYLAEVLGYRYHDSPLAHYDPKDIRVRNMHAIRAYLSALTEDTPRLFVLDDMHWADDTTIEAVEHLVGAMATSRAVLLLMHRPGYRAPAGSVNMELRELDQTDVGRLLASLLGGQVSPQVERLVREHAGGNPFYVEEVARHLYECGLLAVRRNRYDLIRQPTAEEVPPTVEAVIAARIDRLPPLVQRVAQVGAVLGRRFPRRLLAQFEDGLGAIDPALTQLQSAHILFQVSESDEAVFIFKHTLTRDVVYAGILHRRRRALHRKAAATIEALHSTDREQHLPLLAHHYEQAGDATAARACYLAAAEKAAGRHANGEAEVLYRRYLALVDAPTGESVSVRNFLAVEVLQPRGANPDAVAELERALEEGRAIGDDAAQGVSLRGLATIYWETGRMEEAQATCERALQLLRRAGDRRNEGSALMTLANILGDQGHLDEALELYQQCLSIHREVVNVEGMGLCLSNMAEVHRLQGRLDSARDMYEEALALTEQSGYRPATGVVLSNLAVILHELGQIDRARTIFRRALDIHTEVGSRAFEAYTRCEMARLERRSGTDLAVIEAMLEEAEAVANEAGTIDRALCMCERGHLALARDEPARAWLSQAEHLTPVSKVGADSEFGAAIVRLRRAIQAYERGARLYRGERLDDLSTGLRSHLAKIGTLPSAMA